MSSSDYYNPLANQLAGIGISGAGQISPLPGACFPPQLDPLATPWPQVNMRPGDVMPYGPRFGLEKIANGFIIYFAKSDAHAVEKHYVANEKEAGEFVTSRLVQLMLEGERKNVGAEKAAK